VQKFATELTFLILNMWTFPSLFLSCLGFSLHRWGCNGIAEFSKFYCRSNVRGWAMASQPPLPDAVAGWIVGIWGLEGLGTFTIGCGLATFDLT